MINLGILVHSDNKALLNRASKSVKSIFTFVKVILQWFYSHFYSQIFLLKVEIYFIWWAVFIVEVKSKWSKSSFQMWSTTALKMMAKEIWSATDVFQVYEVIIDQTVGK